MTFPFGYIQWSAQYVPEHHVAIRTDMSSFKKKTKTKNLNAQKTPFRKKHYNCKCATVCTKTSVKIV